MGSQLQSVDQTTMKAFSFLALVAAAYASDPYAPPAPYAPPVPAYAPAPVVHAVHAAQLIMPQLSMLPLPTMPQLQLTMLTLTMRRNPKITSLVMMFMVMMNMETLMSTPELNREMDTMSKVSTG